jgi:beta-hydroxyacyl-ACP dehydratase FabZ
MSQTESLFDIQEILKVLPHRYPFLLVDRIIEYEEMRRIVGVKNVTMNEPHFQGHFPGAPVMPGVLILEAMAQVGGFLVFKTLPNRETKLVFFAGVESARFRKPVTPGDQLRIEMVIHKIRGRVGKLGGKAYVDGQVATEAEITFSLVDRPVAAPLTAQA